MTIEDTFTVVRKDKEMLCRFAEVFPGDIRVYKIEGGNTKNWSVTTGRRWKTRFEALGFLKEKGWEVQKARLKA